MLLRTMKGLDNMNYNIYTMYDMVDKNSTRTPKTHPYSFDAYFVFRDFDKSVSNPKRHVIYSDNLMYNDSEKFKKGTNTAGNNVASYSKSEAKKFAKACFGSKYKCVGYSITCNVSNGCPIGMFWIEEVK